MSTVKLSWLQFITFLINGGVLGILASILQFFFFWLLGGGNGGEYFLASLFTYIPLILLNYKVQRTLIFSVNGSLFRFILSNISIMIFVSLLSPLVRDLVTNSIGVFWGDAIGFFIAALIGAIPSFILSRYFVFNLDRNLIGKKS